MNDINNLFTGISKYEARRKSFIQNYFVIHDQFLSHEPDEDPNKDGFVAYDEPRVFIPDPKASVWEFLEKEEVQELLKSRNSVEIKKYLDSMKMDKFQPKGQGRKLFIDLMHSITKFCQKQMFTTEKAGALLSQFYLTHILVTTNFDKSAEKVFTYFKELCLCHTLSDFPPKNAKIFSQEETKLNLQYFCRIYMRNLPLIRFICLPNFAFLFKYPLDKKNDKYFLRKIRSGRMY